MRLWPETYFYDLELTVNGEIVMRDRKDVVYDQR